MTRRAVCVSLSELEFAVVYMGVRACVACAATLKQSASGNVTGSAQCTDGYTGDRCRCVCDSASAFGRVVCCASTLTGQILLRVFIHMDGCG